MTIDDTFNYGTDRVKDIHHDVRLIFTEIGSLFYFRTLGIDLLENHPTGFISDVLTRFAIVTALATSNQDKERSRQLIASQNDVTIETSDAGEKSVVVYVTPRDALESQKVVV